MKNVLVLLAGLALIASVHGTTGISGIVTNADNSHPIISARVCCRAESSRAYTDSTGYYLFSQLAPGTYTVTVGASGFLPDTYPEPVAVVDGQVTPDINFALNPVTPPPTGGLSGHVTNAANGEPISNATAYALGGQGSVHTDSLGFYEIDNLAPRNWMVHCGADGFIWQYTHDSVSVTAGRVTPDINFALVPAPPPESTGISGRVTNYSTGAPIYHANVSCSGQSAVYTDANGVYYVAAGSGPHNEWASADGYENGIYPESVLVTQGQVTEDVGDVNDPVEHGHVVGQTRDQAQPEGRFQGLAPKGPEQGNQGKDQQVRLVPLGEGRGHQQTGEDGG